MNDKFTSSRAQSPKEESEGKSEHDYSRTLFLPKTNFPMRAGLPKREPEFVARWDQMRLYQRLREQARGRDKYILHDGPPYANGHLHIGHALNKILKDIVTRSKQMLGYDSNYVPGWDCHGLPIEWKIEEQYRAKGKSKDDVPAQEFRAECRAFADHWINVQREEFKRLGVVGDWEHPYLTMAYEAEATIAAELMKFAATGQLYRGSKPVMWSVVEQTALAEAEVEYHEHESDTIWAKFPVEAGAEDLIDAHIVIWTTTPWTLPGNRAISYSENIGYGLYKVTQAPEGNWTKVGDRLVVADVLADEVMQQARVDAHERLRTVAAYELEAVVCRHPLRGLAHGYTFRVPLLESDHVSDDAGTGFVHTAPGHGREDFEAWIDHRARIEAKGISSAIPYTVDADGRLTDEAPGLTGAQVITEKGKKGDANKRVIEELIAQNRLLARGRIKHDYPHSWRSKKPIIFRNTPQWFVHMDKDIEGQGDTLRARALAAIDATRFVPPSGQVRLRDMIANRPDWVVSRQRAWGVPIAVFVNGKGEILQDKDVNARILEAFRAEGADAWYAEGARARFLGPDHDGDGWEKVDDILDVWFDSGSTHAFVLEARPDLHTKRPLDGGHDRVMYLEGTDQHRGWFHSSLLESCGTRKRAPYDDVLTHGFTMAEDGRKMSKSLNNQTAPQDVVNQYGADILRLWVTSVDYAEDQRIGPEILKTSVDAYRKLRNTFRWLLGSLAHYRADEQVDLSEMPELERLILHRLSALDVLVREGYEAFDYKRVFSALFNFMTVELSAFYFDVRKDTLYCDAPSSLERRACLTVLDKLFDCLSVWLAPLLCFTCEELWLARRAGADDTDSAHTSIHLQLFPEIPGDWRNDELSATWKIIRRVRRTITGALEIARRDKRIGSSLEAAPHVHIAEDHVLAVMQRVDVAQLAITSGIHLGPGDGPDDAFRLADVPGVAVSFARAEGGKCARCWKILPEVEETSRTAHVCARCSGALEELAALARET